MSSRHLCTSDPCPRCEQAISRTEDTRNQPADDYDLARAEQRYEDFVYGERRR